MGQILLMAVFSLSTPTGISASPVMQRLDTMDQCRKTAVVLAADFKKALPWGQTVSGQHLRCTDLSTGKSEEINAD